VLMDYSNQADKHAAFDQGSTFVVTAEASE
jgi:hypothetical protein